MTNKTTATSTPASNRAVKTRRTFLGLATVASGFALTPAAAIAGVSRTGQVNTADPDWAPLRVGVDISMNTRSAKSLGAVYTTHRSMFAGSLGHTKFFDGGAGITATYNSYMSTVGQYSNDEPRPVLCFKTWDLAAFNAVMDKMTQTWFAVYFQEPQDDAAAGVIAAQPATYLAVYAAMNAARANHPNGEHCYLLKDLMGYRETDHPVPGYTWQNYDGGQRFDRLYVGGDSYSSKFYGSPRTGSYLFQWLVDWHQMSGLRWCIPEYGVATNTKIAGVSTPLDPIVRAQTIQSHIDFARANGARWINYWDDGDTGNGDWRLAGSPSQQVWREAMGR